MNITVVGGGRMGLPLACAFGRRGAHVVVSDIDPSLVETLQAGRCPYDEPGLAPLIAELRATGRLRATTDTADACRSAQAIIVIVPARLTREREIDYGVLEAASADIGRGLQRGALVVYETTISVGGTRQRLVPVLERSSGLRAGRDFHVAYSPERVKANLVFERLETTPKVVGGWDETACDRAAALYGEHLGAPVDRVDTLEAAEMTKLLGMLYRDLNIALANELAAYCELAGVDFERVRHSANRDGEAQLLAPGIGVGGHCTPIYPYFLTHSARRLGLPQRLSELAREINDDQPARQVRRLVAARGDLAGCRVHLLGLGFRPGVRVDACSPAYPLRDELIRSGASVTLSDPYYAEAELRAAGFVPGVPEQAQIVILNTAHAAFLRPDFEQWRAAGVEAVLDGRNAWPQSDVERAGLAYYGVGRAPSAAISRSTSPV